MRGDRAGMRTGLVRRGTIRFCGSEKIIRRPVTCGHGPDGMRIAKTLASPAATRPATPSIAACIRPTRRVHGHEWRRRIEVAEGEGGQVRRPQVHRYPREGAARLRSGEVFRR